MLIALPLIALFVLGPGVIGLILLRRGLRGRRIGDHPVCRKCGFDLFGLPQDRKVCSECGADLNARGAVLIGHRQRRPAMIWSGAALLLVFLTISGFIGINVVRQIDWQQLKPHTWIAWEARRGDAAAWSELTRRAKASELSKEQAGPIVDDALAWQKDLSRKWKTEVGDFVETARGASLVSDEQWQTFARQAPQLSLQWRAKVRPPIGWLPGKIVHGPSRAGTSSRLSVRIVSPFGSDDPLAKQRDANRGSGSSESTLSASGGGWMGVSLELDRAAVAAAAPGKRTTQVQVQTAIRQGWQTTVAEWTEKLSADWELVAKDESTVEIVPDDSAEVRKQVEAALKVEKLEVNQNLTAPAGGTNLSLNLKIAAVPVPLAYDVYLRAADAKEEWKLSSISISGPTGYSAGGSLPAKAKFDAKRVDLIFRPSPAVAESTVDITRMWNGEVIIHDVPVTWPSTQPTK